MQTFYNGTFVFFVSIGRDKWCVVEISNGFSFWKWDNYECKIDIFMTALEEFYTKMLINFIFKTK